jgi:Uncharacterized conserved protein
MGYYGWGSWLAYISVAERKRRAAKKVEQLLKQGKAVESVNIEGRTITKTYWGKSWCKNLESYSDFANRLPRGRSYVRNGAVIDLKIVAGSVMALVNGSEVYKVTIDIAALAKNKWQAIVKECAGKIDSIIELLKGKFSKSVMEVIARKEQGLFPHPNEIKINCSCPDYAEVCKHVAAVFYGVGTRFDTNPELLFTLRQVDHNELIVTDGALETLVKRDSEQLKKTFAGDELSTLFGIDIDVGTTNTKIEDGMEKTPQPYKASKTEAMKKTRKPQKAQKAQKEEKRKKIVKPSKLIRNSPSKSKPQKRIKVRNARRKKHKIS